MTGDKDTRQAALLVADEIREEIARIEWRLQTDSDEEHKETPKPRERWMREADWIRQELLKLELNTLNEWIIQNEFPI
jgi:hypothetical protein